MTTIKQKTAIVELEAVNGQGGRRIVVHRMNWRAQRDFLKKLAVAVQALLAARAAAPEREASLAQLVLSRLTELVAQSDELVNVLCLGSTGLSLDEFDALDSLAAAELLRLSLELNFDDELKNSFAGIVATLAGLMPAAETTSPSASSTTT